MRVAVDYRILTVGRNLMRRGLGRYTQQQLRAVLDVDHDNEYLVFCDAVADTSLVDPAIRAAPNVSIRRLPPAITAPGHQWIDQLRRAEALQSWLLALGVDLYHSTTPFFPCEPFLSSFDACPYVATFYDLIPLLYPGHYMTGVVDRAVYADALSLARNADRLIAISEAAAKDAAGHLGYPSDRIDVAMPAVDACFGVMADDAVEAALGALRPRAPVPTRFMLSVSFPHHAKNMETMLHAFARLPDDVRLRTPLVVCATLSPAASVMWPLARALGVADDLVFTGPVSEEELTALYNRATVVVHPSRYEGFGLPVVEAMRCGAPVITTTASSLPEVGGDAAILVDPDDVEGMADAMLRVQEDPDHRAGMVRRGFAHSATFDLASLARRTLASYQAAVAPAAEAEVAPRLALWSTVPPQSGVVADATADLITGPMPAADVEVFVADGVVPSSTVIGRHPVVHYGAFDRRERQAPFDAVIHHFGPAPHEQFGLEQLRGHPGVVVLHQSCGHPWASHPSLDGVADASVALLAFDPELVHDLSARLPRTPVRLISLGVADPLDGAPAPDRATARTGLGYGEDALVVGVITDVDHAAPVESCLRALTGFGVPAGVVAVGTGPDPEAVPRLRELAAALGLGPSSDLDPVASPLQRATRLAAADVVVSLGRGPCDGCRRATLRALATRTPVIAGGAAMPPATTGAAWLTLPDDGREEAHLAAHLHELAADPLLRQRLAAAGRTWFEEHATLSVAAASLGGVLAEVTRRPVSDFAAAPADPAWDALLQALSA